MKPFSQACENNKQPILAVLQKAFADCNKILEVGSGTGQHAVYFAENMPHLHWQPSDRYENLSGITAWLAESSANNLTHPIELDVNAFDWPKQHFDGIFSANTAHIMAWPEVEKLFTGAATSLKKEGVFCLYGPFNYQGEYTSDSNRQFDQHLKAQLPSMGIRDFEAIGELAKSKQLRLINDHAMPANNRLLCFKNLLASAD